MSLPRLVLSLSVSLLGAVSVGGCSSSDAPGPAGATSGEIVPAPSECSEVGANGCDAQPDDKLPTARQTQQATSIASLADTLADSSAWHRAVDAKALKERERKAILEGDGSDGVFFGAAWRTMNAFPQGHQGFFSDAPNVCGKAIPFQKSSRFGVCGRPSSTGLAVTIARAGNRLGLKLGDVITSAGSDTGDALFEAAYLRPTCGDVYPAASGRRYLGAASFFGTVPAGMKLTVRAASGTTRDVVVPAEADAQPMDCGDVFGRSTQIYAEAKVRPDGVAVIRLPSFFPFDKPFPTNPTQADFDTFVAAYEAEIQKVFDTVKTAPGIVWDARGNTGGITSVGLHIVAGFASARNTALSYCRTRVASSSPPSFETARYAEYAIEKGGPFTYAGKVAVVTDGLAYSAGDYFPRAVARGSDAPLIGAASAGAYGGGRAPIAIDGPPKMSANFDPTACFDASTNKPLEGAPLAPKVAIEYDPRDLATGKDTVIERAVKELGL